jgi:hypothetical protein
MFEKRIGIHVALRLKKTFSFFTSDLPLLRSGFALPIGAETALQRFWNGGRTEAERRMSTQNAIFFLELNAKHIHIREKRL